MARIVNSEEFSQVPLGLSKRNCARTCAGSSRTRTLHYPSELICKLCMTALRLVSSQLQTDGINAITLPFRECAKERFDLVGSRHGHLPLGDGNADYCTALCNNSNNV